MTSQTLPTLPFAYDFETKAVLRKLSKAHRALAELKGVVKSIPNENILISTLALQEAKDSSAIENIITTYDDLFQSSLLPEQAQVQAIKEVRAYETALRCGYDLVRQNGLLLNQHIIKIQECLENNQAGFRKVPGTVLKNQQNGAVVYTPPQNHDEIISLMTNLEKYINDESVQSLDPLVKMALIHYQFESIHPFFDGNGRTGRIINVLYLVTKGLLDLPVLYLSRYIVQNKAEYYSLLQKFRTGGHEEPWLLYMLDAIEQTAIQTLGIVENIKRLMMEMKNKIRSEYSFYNHDLINNLFSHPYTKTEFIQSDLNVSRATAQRYLEALSKDGILQKRSMGRTNYYINTRLYEIFAQVPELKRDREFFS
jgi:Fic family protein